jgi:hypothetical protein
MATQQVIHVSLAKPQDREYFECNINERVAAMAPELEEFNRYMRDLPPERGGGALAPLEMTLIRTYLAWKLSNVTQTTNSTKD